MQLDILINLAVISAPRPRIMAKTNTSKGGPRRAAGSFFANLPAELKSQLRSQSFPGKEPPTPESLQVPTDGDDVSRTCTKQEGGSR